MNPISTYKNLEALNFETCWISPSNIAFIKYWGKKGHQLPANPSLSMTLKECYTKTKVKFTPSDSLQVELFLDGTLELKFAEKIKKYLTTIASDLPLLQKLHLKIETTNTFPHGTGIASSASGLSAFALCLTDYIFMTAQLEINDTFYKTASFLSRLASGSACRSIYGGFTTWGESALPGSSDLYATELSVHSDFAHLKDTVVVTHSDEKSVSSTEGHGRMNEHFFAEARFRQAKHNFSLMVPALESGDFDEVGRVLEAEALSLHAMMLTSPNPYTLIKPKTLEAIEMIWAFRKDTKLPLYFTLDAGPNLHLIYPESYQHKISTFITNELGAFAQKLIFDEVGEGPRKC